jgi:hypothetical protein
VKRNFINAKIDESELAYTSIKLDSNSRSIQLAFSMDKIARLKINKVEILSENPNLNAYKHVRFFPELDL